MYIVNNQTLMERSLMTSLIIWPFLTYLPTYLVLLYDVRFWGLSWSPLPTLISDVINGRSLWQTVPKFWFIWPWYLSFCNTFKSKSLRNNKKVFTFWYMKFLAPYFVYSHKVKKYSIWQILQTLHYLNIFFTQ